MSSTPSILHHGIGLEVPLDAHMADMWQTLRTGEYIEPQIVYAQSTTALTANEITATPFFIARDITIDRLAIQVTTGDSAKIARLGIYNNGTNLYPGTLVVDAGTVSVTNVTVVAATISESLTKGLYWIVAVSDGAPTLWHVQMTWSPLGQKATDFGFDNLHNGWAKAAVGSGALADPFVSGASLHLYRLPTVMPRLLTLD